MFSFLKYFCSFDCTSCIYLRGHSLTHALVHPLTTSSHMAPRYTSLLLTGCRPRGSAGGSPGRGAKHIEAIRASGARSVYEHVYTHGAVRCVKRIHSTPSLEFTQLPQETTHRGGRREGEEEKGEERGGGEGERGRSEGRGWNRTTEGVRNPGRKLQERT